MRNYVQGELVRLEHEFRNQSGDLVDPAFIRFSTLTEADVTTFYDYDDASSNSSNSDSDDAPPGVVVRDSTGSYHVDIDTADQSGVYFWRVRSENPSDADQDQFYVVPAEIDDESSDDSSSSS